MAVHLSNEFRGLLPVLRFEPAQRRVRAEVGGRTVVDSDRALLVWEARRVTPVFAVPAEDIAAELVAVDALQPDLANGFQMEAGGPRLLDPRSGFRRHTGPGEEFTLRLPAAAGPAQPEGNDLVGAAFRPADGDLADCLLLDFAAFDRWLEEDQVIEGHPRDPFHRVDARASSRHVRVEFAGRLLAETRAPVFLYETMLPVRSYLPRSDVDWDLLEPSGHRTVCPYKGHATYWSVTGGDPKGRNLAWSYEQTLPDSGQLRDLVAFFDERADVVVDGRRRETGPTPWS